MFTVWHGLFSLVLLFSGLRIEAPIPSTVQGKWIYTFLKQRTILKQRTSRFNFRSYVLNLVKINKFLFFQRLVVLRPIYWPLVPSEHYQIEQFIGQACHNSRIEWADLSAKHAY